MMWRGSEFLKSHKKKKKESLENNSGSQPFLLRGTLALLYQYLAPPLHNIGLCKDQL